jgi:hypothetical protein
MLCVQFLSSWWWAEKPPETCRAVTIIQNIVKRCISLDIPKRIVTYSRSVSDVLALLDSDDGGTTIRRNVHDTAVRTLNVSRKTLTWYWSISEFCPAFNFPKRPAVGHLNCSCQRLSVCRHLKSINCIAVCDEDQPLIGKRRHATNCTWWCTGLSKSFWLLSQSPRDTHEIT